MNLNELPYRTYSPCVHKCQRGATTGLSVQGRDVRCPDCLWGENKQLRDKLQRLRDWLKFAANSESGVVDEIDKLLEASKAAGGK